ISDDSSGRAISTSVVFSPSESDCTALRYISFLSPRPDRGPKQEAPCVPPSKKPVQAVGNDNKRSVWPVGAVSITHNHTDLKYCHQLKDVKIHQMPQSLLYMLPIAVLPSD